MTISEALDHERSSFTEFKNNRAALQQEMDDTVLSGWRTWVQTEGKRSARRLFDLGGNYLASAKQSLRGVEQIKKWHVARETLDDLGKDLTTVDETDSDDGLTVLMVSVGFAAEQIQEVANAAAQDQARRSQLDEAVKWVEDHGSSRLRKAMTLGLLGSSMGAYRDERLAVERSGWRWWDSSNYPAKNLINPSERDLDALIDARKVDSNAHLTYIQGIGSVITSSYMSRAIFVAVSDIDSETM